MNNDYLMIRIPTELKLLLQKRAEAEHRDMSKQVIHLIEKDLRESGAIEPSPTPTTENQ